MILPQAEPLIICDASPLILLAKISHAALLFQIAREVWIPAAVWDEITRNSGSPPELPSLLSLFSQCVRAADQPLQAAFQTQVDAGEAAALALAMRHPGALLLMGIGAGGCWRNTMGFATWERWACWLVQNVRGSSRRSNRY